MPGSGYLPAAVAEEPCSPRVRMTRMSAVRTGSEEPAAPALRRRWRAPLEYAAALAVALVLAELGARLFLRLPARVQPSPLSLKEAVAEERAPGLGEWLRPGAEATARYPALGGGSEAAPAFREVLYRINADGFRDRRFPRERVPGTYRIAVLGDSVAFGFGVDAADSPPKQLERELAALLDEGVGERVEVMNCGIYSFNATQQAAHLRHRVAPFAPDLVLFLTTVTDASGRGIEIDPAKNDNWEVRWTNRLGLTSGRFTPVGAGTSPARRRMLALRRRSALVDFAANRAYTWLRSRVMKAGYLHDWSEGSPGRAAVAAAFADAHALGRERGFEVRVALYPVLDSLDDYPMGPVHEAVRALAAAEGLDFHDLLAAFTGQHASELHAHAHDKHPNARANALAAEALAAELAPPVAQVLGVAETLGE